MGILRLKVQHGGVHVSRQPQTRTGGMHWVTCVMDTAFRLCGYVMHMQCLSVQQLGMHHLLTGSLMLHDVPVHLPHQGTQAAKGRRYGVQLYLRHTHTHTHTHTATDTALYCTALYQQMQTTMHFSAHVLFTQVLSKQLVTGGCAAICVCVCEPVWHWCCRLA